MLLCLESEWCSLIAMMSLGYQEENKGKTKHASRKISTCRKWKQLYSSGISSKYLLYKEGKYKFFCVNVTQRLSQSDIWLFNNFSSLCRTFVLYLIIYFKCPYSLKKAVYYTVGGSLHQKGCRHGC